MLKAKVLAIVVAMLLLATAVPAAADVSPTPQPSPSSSPTLTPSPASDAMVAWACGWRVRAVRVWESWNRARRCFDYERVRFGAPKPDRSEPNAVWYAAGREWKHSVSEYREKRERLRYRMIHPGGSGGERWRPLVRWHWPAALVDDAVRCLTLESHGNPHARNSYSGAAGLFQLYPAPDGWANPDYNVWYAYHRKYLPAGSFAPWVVM